MTELLVAFVVRTRRPFWASRPSRLLLWLSVGVAAAAIAIPFSPLGGLVGLVPLRPATLALVVAISLSYAAAVELVKGPFFRRFESAGTRIRET